MIDEERKKKLERIKKWRDTSEKAKRLGIKSIGEAAPYLVEGAKEFGMNLEGVEHEVDNDFKVHAIKKHGDPVKERARGQTPITVDDIDRLRELVNFPYKAVLGAKNKKGVDVIHYASDSPDGSDFYAEHYLSSDKNDSLRGKSYLRIKGNFNEKQFLNFMSNNKRNDLSNIKTIVPAGAGGYLSSDPILKPAVVANPTVPTGRPSTNNLPQNPQNVNGKKGENRFYFLV